VPGFPALAPETRLACGGVLLAVAAADGVIDDEELLPILGDLDLRALGDAAVHCVAAWVVEPPTVDEAVGVLVGEHSAVRFGVVARMLEVAGTDAFLAPGELERLAHAAHALGIDADQLDALRVFVAEMRAAGALAPGDPTRQRKVAGAGHGLVLVGVPWGALAFCAGVRALGDEADLIGPALGFPPGVSLADLLGTPKQRKKRAEDERERTRTGLELLTAALDRVPDPAVAVRKRALSRRMRSLAPG
jgi:hypothetical protein